MNVLGTIVRLVFPPKCIFCGEVLSFTVEVDICSKCYSRIPFTQIDLSRLNRNVNFSTHCDDIICICEYSGIIKEAIVKYKFFNRPGYHRTFARLMSDKLKKMTDCKKFDIILSVPLHKSKERIRGYNQSQLIAKALSRDLGTPEASGIIARIKNTDAQSLLNKDDRDLNIRGAFRVHNDKMVNNKTILLIDDVLTTGSTIGECCRILKEAGAGSVTAVVIASGKKY